MEKTLEEQKNEELKYIIQTFFDDINNYLNENLNAVYGTFNTSEYLKDYKKMEDYCMKNLNVVYDCIDYIYPYIDTNVENIFNQLINKTFKNYDTIHHYLSLYKNKFLKLIQNDLIFNLFYKILFKLFKKLCKHIEISYTKEDDLKILIKKLYCNKHKIKLSK